MGHFAIWAGSLLAWFVVVFHSSTVADWPQGRGPRRDGILAAFKVPAEWPKDLHKQWQVEVGLGYSSPVVAAGNAYIFSRRDDDEVLACVRSGRRQGVVAPRLSGAVPGQPGRQRARQGTQEHAGHRRAADRHLWH